MSNVTHLPYQRTPEQQRRADRQEIGSSGLAPVRTLRARDLVVPPNPTLPPVDTLETELDTYRSTMLELAHRRKAFEMQMMLEENTAQIKLEAAAYKAMLAGVPESDIYALGEDMAEALSSAMDTVAGA